MKNIKEYLIEIIDENTIKLSLDLLTNDYDCNLDELEIESEAKEFLIIRDSDADLDDGELVDCSTYSIKVNSIFCKIEDSIIKEIWEEISNLDEYRSKYLSY